MCACYTSSLLGRLSFLPCLPVISVTGKPVTNALCGLTQTIILEAVPMLDAPTLSPLPASPYLSQKVRRGGLFTAGPEERGGGGAIRDPVV